MRHDRRTDAQDLRCAEGYLSSQGMISGKDHALACRLRGRPTLRNFSAALLGIVVPLCGPPPHRITLDIAQASKGWVGDVATLDPDSSRPLGFPPAGRAPSTRPIPDCRGHENKDRYLFGVAVPFMLADLPLIEVGSIGIAQLATVRFVKLGPPLEATNSPHRLLRPLRPFLVVGFRVDIFAAGDFQYFSRRRQ